MTDVADPAGYGLTLRQQERDHPDAFVNDHLTRIETRVHELAAIGAQHYDNIPGLGRRRISSIDWTNPATVALTAHDPSIEAWLRTIPTAAALHPLYDPDAECLPNGIRIGDEMREWVRNLADARGIRSRAAVLRELLLEEAENRSDRPSRWLSLACGAAQPILLTMEESGRRGLPIPEVTLADLDGQALRLAGAYAAESGLTSRTRTVRMNVLRRQGFAAIPNRIGIPRSTNWPGSFDMVEAIGLLEYLKPEDWKYSYGRVVSTKHALAGAVTFLRNAFECVKPGGLLVVGNMLDTHPQLGFTLDVVQWPHIQPRSVAEMQSIFTHAGIEGHVDAHLPSDGVYAIYAIRKFEDTRP